jgi:glucosyl-3-phosphoglycerate synthase
MTVIWSNPRRAAAGPWALNVDVAVIVSGASGRRTEVEADRSGQDLPAVAELGQGSDRLLECFGPVLGVGDAIWRALATVTAEVVCVGSEWSLNPAHVERLTQPLIENPGLMLVSGVDDPFSLRPGPRMGDRLTELVARPLVARYQPSLAGFRQPLLGSFAARRSLLGSVPFPVGAGIRLSLLIDALRDHGRDAVAEVALRENSPDDRPLRELGADAAELIVALCRRSPTIRAVADERLLQPWNDFSRIALATVERPPLERVLAAEGPRASSFVPASATTHTPSGAHDGEL